MTTHNQREIAVLTLQTVFASLKVFAFSDNFFAENSKSFAVFGSQRNHFFRCMFETFISKHISKSKIGLLKQI